MGRLIRVTDAALFFIITVLLFSFISCNNKMSEIKKDEAVIIYDGDPAVDGYGWFLSINEMKYKPIELDTEFCKDGLIVNVKYQLLDTKWSCNWQRKEYPLIKIIDIAKE